MTKELLYKEALYFHTKGRPGKFSVEPTKSLATQKELSLAYSPGVAAPCLEIAKSPESAYQYTIKGNLVAVISNGTAVLGLGNIGALASKPVMEGKAVLFKRFADIDAIDLEVGTEDIEEFINAVKHLGPTFGGINLEDIRAPECFIIEERLKAIMDIPVFHDDQHGTAIAVVAGLMNALDIAKKAAKDVKVVFNGAGAAAIACANLIVKMGVPQSHIIMLDREGVIHDGRTDLNEWKLPYAQRTAHRTLEDAIKGADVFVGLSVKDVLTEEMVKSMAQTPIIFAMANPDPEITPEKARAARHDAIVATGRSDHPNQVNNALCFPYIFRGALDVHAKHINDEMKLAAAEAIAKLAKEDVPEEANRAYAGKRLQFGPDYIIPVPFDPRLIELVPPAVAEAAKRTGVARKPIEDYGAYAKQLRGRLDPTSSNLEIILEKVRTKKKKVIFAEGEEETAIRAAINFHNQGLGKAILVGRENHIEAALGRLNLQLPQGIQIHNAKFSEHNEFYIQFLYERLKRKGFLARDCQRLVHQDRNVFSACMVVFGHADAMVTGLTRHYGDALDDICKVIDPHPGCTTFGFSIVMVHGKSILIADTTVNETPSPEMLADIAIQSAKHARALGHDPRVAFLSYSNFGNPSLQKNRAREAVALLDQMNVDFEYEGDMTVDVALNMDARKHYPFCRLSEPANILVMPDRHTASIAAELLQEFSDGSMVGPILSGLAHSAQIVHMATTAAELTQIAALAAYQASWSEKKGK